MAKDTKSERIGLFGGTFNPIHMGHLEMIREVREHFRMNEIHLIPAAVPPHKDAADIAGIEDRLEMVRMACRESPAHFHLSEVEIRRPGPSYSIDTARHFYRLKPHADLYLIMGSDAFLEMDSWKSWPDLLETIAVIVMVRPPAEAPEADEENAIVSRLQNYLLSKIAGDYKISETGDSFYHPVKKPIHIYKGSLLGISATMIRDRVKTGKSILSLVPGAVADYIMEKGLYR